MLVFVFFLEIIKESLWSYIDGHVSCLWLHYTRSNDVYNYMYYKNDCLYQTKLTYTNARTYEQVYYGLVLIVYAISEGSDETTHLAVSSEPPQLAF